jgi:hypothetical protein
VRQEPRPDGSLRQTTGNFRQLGLDLFSTMTRRNEKRVPNPADASRKAAVVPFEKPAKDPQHSLRTRMQERLDRERERIKPRISPLRVAVTLAIAVIPVMLTYGAADFVLRRVQLLTKLYTTDLRKDEAARPAPPPAVSEDSGVLLMMPDPSITGGEAADETGSPPP